MVRLTAQARNFRTQQTGAECVLWAHLRNRQFKNVKFRRQVQIGPFFVDFVSVEKMLVVELDGGVHRQRVVYDERRSDYLKDRGFKMLRFWNNEVLKDVDGVLERIGEVLV